MSFATGPRPDHCRSNVQVNIQDVFLLPRRLQQEYISRRQATHRDQCRRSSHDLSRGSHRSQSPDGRVRLRHREAKGDKRTLDASGERRDSSVKRRREDGHSAKRHTEAVTQQRRHARPSDKAASRGHVVDQPRRASSQHSASPSCDSRLSDPRTGSMSPAIRDVRCNSDPDLKSSRVCPDRDGDRRHGRFQNDSTRRSLKKEDEVTRSEAGTPEVATPADDCVTEVSEGQESAAADVKKSSSHQLGISDYERMRGYLSLQQKRTLAQQISFKNGKRLRNRMIADYGSRSADYDEYVASLHREQGSVANKDTLDCETNDMLPCGDSKYIDDVTTSDVALSECTSMVAQTVSTHGCDMTGTEVLESESTAKGEPIADVIPENLDQIGVSLRQKHARSLEATEESMASFDTRNSRVSSGYGSVDSVQTTGDVSHTNISQGNRVHTWYSNTDSLQAPGCVSPSNTKSRLISTDQENTAPLGMLLSVLKQSCSHSQLSPSTSTGQNLQSDPVASLLDMLKKPLPACITTAISPGCSSTPDVKMSAHSQIVQDVPQDLKYDSTVQQANLDVAVIDSTEPISTSEIDIKKALNDITLENGKLLHTVVETENGSERNDKHDFAVQEEVVNLNCSKVGHSAAKLKSSAKRHKVAHASRSTAERSRNDRSSRKCTTHRMEKQITEPEHVSASPNCSILVTSFDDTTDSVATSSQPHADGTTVNKSFTRATEATGAGDDVDSDVSDSAFVIGTNVSSDNRDSSSSEMDEDLWDISLQTNNSSKGNQCRSVAADSQSTNRRSLGHKATRTKDCGVVSKTQVDTARNNATSVSSAHIRDPLVLKSREHHAPDDAKLLMRSSSDRNSKAQQAPLVVLKSKLKLQESLSKHVHEEGPGKRKSNKDRLTGRERKPSKSRVASTAHDNTSPHGMLVSGLNRSCNDSQPTPCTDAGQTSQSARVATLVDQMTLRPGKSVLSDVVPHVSLTTTDSWERETLLECMTTVIAPGCSSTPDVTMLVHSQIEQGVANDRKCDRTVQQANSGETVVDSSTKSLATSDIDIKLSLNDIRLCDIESPHTVVETESSNNRTKVGDIAVQEETVNLICPKDRHYRASSDSGDAKRQSSANKHKVKHSKQDRNKNDLSSEKCKPHHMEEQVTEPEHISTSPNCPPLVTSVDGATDSIVPSSQHHADIATVEKEYPRAIETTGDNMGADDDADSDFSDSAFVIDTTISPVKSDNRHSSSTDIDEDLWDISLQSNSANGTCCRKAGADLQSRNCGEAAGSKKDGVGGVASMMQLNGEKHDSTNASVQDPLDVLKSRDHRKSYKAPVVRRSSGDRKGKVRQATCVDNKSELNSRKCQSKAASYKGSEKKRHPSNQHQLTHKQTKPSKSQVVCADQENTAPHGTPLSVLKQSCHNTQPTPSAHAGQTSQSTPVATLVDRTPPSPGKGSLSGVVPHVSLTITDSVVTTTLPDCATTTTSPGYSSLPDVAMLARSEIVQGVPPRDHKCDSTVQRTNVMDNSELVSTDEIDIGQSFNDVGPTSSEVLHAVVQMDNGSERTNDGEIAVQELPYFTASDSTPTKLNPSAKRRKVLSTHEGRNKIDLNSEKCTAHHKEEQITEPEHISTSPNCPVLLASVDDTTDSNITGSQHHADSETVEKSFTETSGDNTGADDDDADSDVSESTFVIDTTVSPVKSDKRDSSSSCIDEDLWDISLKSNHIKDSRSRHVGADSRSRNRGSLGLKAPGTKDGGVVGRRQLDGARNDAENVTAHVHDPRGVVRSRDHRMVDKAPMVRRSSDDRHSNVRMTPRAARESKRTSQPSDQRQDGPEKKRHLSNQHRLTQMESNDYRRPAHHHNRPQKDSPRRRGENAGTRITTSNRSHHIASSSPVSRRSGAPERGCTRGSGLAGDGTCDRDHGQKERRIDVQSPSQRRSAHRGSKDHTSGGGIPSSSTKRAVGDTRDNDKNIHARTQDTRHKDRHSRTRGVVNGVHDNDHLRVKVVVDDTRCRDPIARRQGAIKDTCDKNTGARTHVNDEREKDIHARTHTISTHDKRNRARRQSVSDDTHGEDVYLRAHRRVNDTHSKDTNVRADGAVYSTRDKDTGVNTHGVVCDSRNEGGCTQGVVDDAADKDTPTLDVSTPAQDDSTEEGEIVSEDEEVSTSNVTRRRADDSCRSASGVDTMQKHGSSRPRSSHRPSGRRSLHSTKTNH